jgi:hypothetical protein
MKWILFVGALASFGSVPVSGQEHLDRSRADRLEYVGIAVEEPDYHVWGSSLVIGPEGKTHLFVARWPLKEEFKAWLTHCEIARYVSDSPEGPFVFQEVVVKGSWKDGAWDFQSPHNPTIQKVGDRYRYLRYGDGSEELYDHYNDPNEWTNLANDPQFEGVKQQLAQHLKRALNNHD